MLRRCSTKCKAREKLQMRHRCKKFRKLGKVRLFWRISLLRIIVRAKKISDSAWTSATSTHATFLEIVQEIQEVGQSKVVLEDITVAHCCPGQNLFRLCVDISNLDACYLLGNYPVVFPGELGGRSNAGGGLGGGWPPGGNALPRRRSIHRHWYHQGRSQTSVLALRCTCAQRTLCFHQSRT